MTTRFFYDNLITKSATTITAADEDVFYPASNLQHQQSIKEFRTNSGTLTTTIVFDLQTAQNVDSFCIVGNNSTGILSLTSFKVEGNTTDVWTSPAFDSTTQTLDIAKETNENFAYRALAPVAAYRYWRLTVTNSSGFAGFSNIFLGEKLELTNNAFTYGWSWQRVDNSTVQVGRYKQRYIDRISDQKVISGEFQYLDASEFESLEVMTNDVGIYKPVWVQVDPDELIVNNQNIFAGYFLMDKRPAYINTAFGLYNTKFDFSECI